MVLLSSSAFDDPRLLSYSLSATGKSTESARVAIVISASPMKATGPNAIKTMSYLKENRVHNSSFVDLCDGRSAKSEIQDSDIILFNGGNPFLLLSTLQKQDYLDDLRRLSLSEKIVVGVRTFK